MAKHRTGRLPDDREYRQLLEFRTGLRRFLRWSEAQAAAAGLSPAHHQLLLAVRGHVGESAPTVGEIADVLLLKHHSAVELIDRAATRGLVERLSDAVDQRVIRVALTDLGRRKLAELSAVHLEELRRLGPSVQPIWDGLGNAPS